MLTDSKNKPLIILETDKDIKFSSNSWGHSFKMTEPFDWKWFWKADGVWNRFWDWPEFCMNVNWITEFLKKSDAGQPQTASDSSETRPGHFSKGSAQDEVAQTRVQLGKKKMPPDPAMNNIMQADSHDVTMTLRRTYGMVISSYENVARKDQLTSDAAEQLGRTVSSRIKELNRESQRKIEDLPEYKNLNLKDIRELGEELSDRITEKDEYLQAFALLKHPVFADLMESTETVHRSFSEMMEANGEEHLMFGVFEMIKNMGGLARSQESTQVAQGNNKLNIRV